MSLADRLKCRIGDLELAVDLHQFERAPLNSIAQVQDVGSEPSERSFENQGIWKRTGRNFIQGAGQEWFDLDDETDDADRRRFRWARGATMKTLGKLSATKVPTAGGSLVATSASRSVHGDGFGYTSYGAVLRYYTAVQTEAAVTGESGVVITDLGLLNGEIYVADGASVYKGTVGAAISSWSTIDTTYLVVGPGRLIGMDANSVWEFDDTGALLGGATIWDHDNANFVWKGGAYAPNGLYIFGDDGAHSEVYLLTPVDATGELANPYPVMPFPPGWIIQDMDFYAGVMIIGTNKGLHTATIGGSGFLTYGPLREVGSVESIVAQGQDVYYTVGSIPDVAGTAEGSGVGRLGMDRFTDPLVPSYEDFLIVTSGTNVPKAIMVIDDRVAFTVVEGTTMQQYYEHASTLVTTMEFATGKITYGTPEDKAFTSLEIKHSTLAANDSIAVTLVVDGVSHVLDTTQALDSDAAYAGRVTRCTWSGDDPIVGEDFEARVTVTFGTPGGHAAFDVDRWTLRVIPMQRRAEVIQIGVMLSSNRSERGRVGVRGNPLADFEYLLGLAASRTPTEFVFGDRVDQVVVDAIMMNQNQSNKLVEDWDHDTDGREFVNATWTLRMITNADG